MEKTQLRNALVVVLLRCMETQQLRHVKTAHLPVWDAQIVLIVLLALRQQNSHLQINTVILIVIALINILLMTNVIVHVLQGLT